MTKILTETDTSKLVRALELASYNPDSELYELLKSVMHNIIVVPTMIGKKVRILVKSVPGFSHITDDCFGIISDYYSSTGCISVDFPETDSRKGYPTGPNWFFTSNEFTLIN